MSQGPLLVNMRIGRPGAEATASMATKVYEQLKDAIVSCAVRPGENLHEADLAALFNVSKTPVREAIHLLRREGLIESFARHGHRVAPVTVDDVKEIYDLRLIVDPAIAAVATPLLGESALEELRGLSHVLYVPADSGSYESFLVATRRFQEVMAAATGNGRLMALSKRLVEESERLLRLTFDDADVAGELVAQRGRIVEALTRRDPVAAAAIAREQLEGSRRRVLDVITRRPSRSEDPEPGSQVAWSVRLPGREWSGSLPIRVGSDADEADEGAGSATT